MKFFDNTDIAYFYGANLAGYDSRRDIVLMPARNDFKTETGFVSTLAHETIHATGHKNRLNRDMKGRFGNESYAFEELIADIGAGFVVGYLGYGYQFSKNNLAYLKSWLKVLKNDKKAIFKACSEAQKAFDYCIHENHVLGTWFRKAYSYAKKNSLVTIKLRSGNRRKN